MIVGRIGLSYSLVCLTIPRCLRRPTDRGSSSSSNQEVRSLIMTDSSPCRHGSPCGFSYHFSIFSFIPSASSCSRLQSPPPSLALSSLPSSSFYPHSLSHHFFYPFVIVSVCSACRGGRGIPPPPSPTQHVDRAVVILLA